MARILDCAAVAAAVAEDCRARAQALRAAGIVPKLAILRVGEKSADISYEKGAVKAMEACGVDVEIFTLPAEVSQAEYIRTLRAICADGGIHGVLPFRPLDGIDETAAITNVVPAEMDCDGAAEENLGKLLLGNDAGLFPCTAEAIVAVLDHYADEIRALMREKYAEYTPSADVCSGLNVCILNRSNTIGKPLSMLLVNRGATVSVLHTRTLGSVRDDYIRRADVVVVATPVKNTLTGDMLGDRAIVIDAGVIREKLFDENGVPVMSEKTGKQKIRVYGSSSADVAERAAWITPVPGIGSITSAMLVRNAVKACRIRSGI